MPFWITGTLGLVTAEAPDKEASSPDLTLAITECQGALHQGRRLQLNQFLLIEEDV